MHNRREFLLYAIWLTLLASRDRLGFDTGDFTDNELTTLAAAIDEIIPAGDGMPSASQVSGVQYLKHLGWQYPEIRESISHVLKTLERISAAQFQGKFATLRSDQRSHILRSMEKTDASAFSTLVSYGYESYYTNPRVLGLISCAPASVPAQEDEVLLTPVRKLRHLYRQIP